MPLSLICGDRGGLPRAPGDGGSPPPPPDMPLPGRLKAREAAAAAPTDSTGTDSMSSISSSSFGRSGGGGMESGRAAGCGDLSCGADVRDAEPLFGGGCCLEAAHPPPPDEAAAIPSSGSKAWLETIIPWGEEGEGDPGALVLAARPESPTERVSCTGIPNIYDIHHAKPMSTF